MATPDYVLMEAVIFRNSSGTDPITIEKGSFVRPIEYEYLPQFVKNDSRWRNVNLNQSVFCFTRFGIFPIERSAVRQV